DGNHARVIVELTADRIHVGNRDRRESELTVRGDRLDRVAIIQGGLERLDGKSRVTRLVQASNQFLSLAAEHTAADQVETSGWFIEPDLLKGLGTRLRRVMP